MIELRFSKFGEGVCQNCGVSSTELYYATMTSNGKTNNYAVCNDCAGKLRNMVAKKNAEAQKNSQQSSASRCLICGNAIKPGESACSICGLPTVNPSAAKAEPQQQAYQPQQQAYQPQQQAYQPQQQAYQPQQQAYQPQPEVKIKNQESTYYRDNPKNAHKYDKLGGWLVVFIIGQVFGFLFDIALFSSSGTYAIIVVAYAIFDAVMSFFIIENVVKKKGNFVKLFEIQQFVSIPFLLFSLFAFSSGNVDSSKLGTDIFRIFLYYAIWLEYFEKSSRCEVYFGGREYLLNGILAKAYYKKHYQ